MSFSIRCLFATASIWLLASCISEQPPGVVPQPYEPGRILYAPEQRALRECNGFALGLDPRWTFNSTIEQEGRNGLRQVIYESNYGFAVARRLNPNPVSSRTVH